MKKNKNLSKFMAELDLDDVKKMIDILETCPEIDITANKDVLNFLKAEKNKKNN